MLRLLLFFTLLSTASIVGYCRIFLSSTFLIARPSSNTSPLTTDSPSSNRPSSSFLTSPQRWKYSDAEANELFSLWKQQECRLSRRMERNYQNFQPSISNSIYHSLHSVIPTSFTSSLSSTKLKLKSLAASTQKFLFPGHHRWNQTSTSQTTPVAGVSQFSSLSSLSHSVSSSLPLSDALPTSPSFSSFLSKQNSLLHRNLPILIDRLNEYFLPTSLPLSLFLSLPLSSSSFSFKFPYVVPFKKIYNYSLTLSVLKLLSDSFQFYTNFSDKTSFSVLPLQSNLTQPAETGQSSRSIRLPSLTSFWYPIKPSRNSFAVLTGKLTSLQQELSVRLMLSGYNLLLVTDQPYASEFARELLDLQSRLTFSGNENAKNMTYMNINRNSKTDGDQSTVSFEQSDGFLSTTFPNSLFKKDPGLQVKVDRDVSSLRPALLREVKVIQTNFSHPQAAVQVYEEMKRLRVLNKIDVLVCNSPGIPRRPPLSIPPPQASPGSSGYSTILPGFEYNLCLDELSKTQSYLQESLGFTVSLLDKLVPHVILRARAPRTFSSPDGLSRSAYTSLSTAASAVVSDTDIDSFSEKNLLTLWNNNKKAITGGGRIMLISPCNEDVSCSSLIRISPSSAYLKSLAKCLRQELLPHGVLVSYAKPSFSSQFMREYSEDIDSNLPHQNKQSEALDAPLSLDSFAFDVSDEFSFSSSPGSGDSMKHPQDVNRQEPLITSLPFFSPSLSQTSYAIYKGILTGKSEVSVGLQSFIHNNFLKSTLSAPVLSSISKFLLTPITPPAVLFKKFLHRNIITYYSPDQEDQEQDSDLDTLDP